jgi:hypothetical protein
VGEVVGEAAPGVNLDEQTGDLQVREPGGRRVAKLLGAFGQVFGREPAGDQLAIVVQADPPVAFGEHRLDRLQGGVQLLAKLVQAGPAVGGDAGQLAQFGPKRRPAVDGQEIAGRIGVTPGTLHPHIPRAQGVSEYVENYQFPVVAVGRAVTVPGGFQVLTPPGGHEVAGGVVGHPPSSASVQVLQDLDGLQQPGRLRAPTQGQGGQHARG